MSNILLVEQYHITIMPISNNQSPLKVLAEQLLRIDNAGMPDDFLENVKKVAKLTSRKLTVLAGEFLTDINEKKNTEEQVQVVIEAFPGALFHRDKDDWLPIHKASWKFVSVVPLMAQEGNRLNVGGEDCCGGLTEEMDYKESFWISLFSYQFNGVYWEDSWDVIYINCLQLLCARGNYPGRFPLTDREIEHDIKCTRVFEQLRTMGLLKKEHILEYDLLLLVTTSAEPRRFDFFTRWHPEVLKSAGKGGYPLTWDTVPKELYRGEFNQHYYKECFELVLKAGMMYFAEDMGLLFHKHDNITACEKAFTRYGEVEAMNIIRQCIPPSDNHTILHYIAKYAPDLMNQFATYYPDAAYLLDSENRTFFQSALASGNKTYVKDSLFFIRATDDEVAEKDPLTQLFPFALAATDNTSDLGAVYVLLRRNPGVIFYERGLAMMRKRRKRYNEKSKVSKRILSNYM